MPTAARLVGAVVFFGVGWAAALQVLTTVPEGTPATFFPVTIAMIGLWQGWSVAGANAGRGRSMAVANGLRTSIQIAALGLIVFALRTMFERSMSLRYDGFGEAVVAAMDLFIEYFFQSLIAPVWGVLLVGGVIGGLICEGAARRWR
ncbi:TrgA family protein [Roseicyclus persicicus]|uniref:TrgA family protein n=1 Tax=Roseicyclus persicicus TaxID=2650661 RepID=A0A7X6JYR8_9RHOB|nr:TrgA family protein [Roseibacterium persicicum]NKX46140.1 TrgA family protein [Roseibacterium persicicum]